MENKKTNQKNSQGDSFIKITLIQFLVCGFMVLLVFAICRLSPDGAQTIKTKYNQIMLTDISFSQVWESAKQVAKYVMKPVDIDGVNEVVTATPDNEYQEEEQVSETVGDEEAEPQAVENDGVAAVMSFFGETDEITSPVHGRITSYFGARVHPVSRDEDVHNAIDIAVDEGTCVAAAWDGVVSETGYDNTKGNYVRLVHKNGSETFYCHCSQILVNEGTVIRAGETIAFSGDTGVSTGPHLHFAVKENGEYVDPLIYLEEKDGRV